ncbi:MAG: ABC transporter ATP-binding protein [Saprospiraceae bacterium]|nr:ABC transporter ATP-binding protein [Saprospiraceae bacterium]
MKSLYSINKYFYRYRWRLLIGTLFVIASNYFMILQPQLIRDALNMVVEDLKLSPEELAAQDQSMTTSLMIFAAYVFGAAILMGIFMFMMRQTIIVVSRLIEYDMRKDIYEHYQKLHLGFYRQNKTGDLMARITEDVSKVRMYLGPALLYAINIVSLFVMVTYAMFSVNTELAIYSLLPLPILSVSIYFVSAIINKKSELIQKQLSVLNSTSQEVFSGIRIVKSFVQERQIGQRFADQTEVYKEKSLGLAKIDALFGPLMLLIIGASTILTIYFGGKQVIAGTLQAGNIAEFVIYVNMLTWPVTSIGWIASLVQQAAVSQRRINEFLDTKPEIINHNHEVYPINGHVVFDNVSFTYPDTGIKAIRNLNLNIQPGERIAIVGRTGSGKTTIADLLLRMYDPDSGSILIDEKPLEKHNLAHLREKIGYVPQDVFLFSDSISNNIAFGTEGADQEKIEKFSQHALVYEDIIGFPKTFETMVGERGVTLSGGQKQRVSIARALIKDPEIVILDDSLSAVDTTTEQMILQYLNTALKGKTAIIITHRIYESMDFDKIVVLENGTIVEEGTHAELLQNQGYYARMFEQQKTHPAD